MLCCGSNSSHINPYQVALMYKHFKVNGKNDLNCQWYSFSYNTILSVIVIDLQEFFFLFKLHESYKWTHFKGTHAHMGYVYRCA